MNKGFKFLRLSSAAVGIGLFSSSILTVFQRSMLNVSGSDPNISLVACQQDSSLNLMTPQNDTGSVSETFMGSQMDGDATTETVRRDSDGGSPGLINAWQSSLPIFSSTGVFPSLPEWSNRFFQPEKYSEWCPVYLSNAESRVPPSTKEIRQTRPTAQDDDRNTSDNLEKLKGVNPPNSVREQISEPRRTLYLFETLHQHGAVERIRYFLSSSKNHVIAFCTAGHGVSGHPGVTHGGFTAAVIDDVAGFLANFHLMIGATTNLTVNYRKPIIPGETMVVVANVVSSGDHTGATKDESVGDTGGGGSTVSRSGGIRVGGDERDGHLKGTSVAEKTFVRVDDVATIGGQTDTRNDEGNEGSGNDRESPSKGQESKKMKRLQIDIEVYSYSVKTKEVQKCANATVKFADVSDKWPLMLGDDHKATRRTKETERYIWVSG